MLISATGTQNSGNINIAKAFVAKKGLTQGQANSDPSTDIELPPILLIETETNRSTVPLYSGG